MKKTAFIFHGVEGNPGENWFPWLKTQLELKGWQVFVPQFPTPEGQTLENWLEIVKGHEDKMDENTVYIGHSLGGAFVLNLLEAYPARAAFFVAGVYGKVGNTFDESMKSFAQRQFDWEKIHGHCFNFCVYHADNDPYIKLKTAEDLAEKLGVEVNLIEGGGHFNAANGYLKFPRLLEDILSFDLENWGRPQL